MVAHSRLIRNVQLKEAVLFQVKYFTMWVLIVRLKILIQQYFTFFDMESIQCGTRQQCVEIALKSYIIVRALVRVCDLCTDL